MKFVYSNKVTRHTRIGGNERLFNLYYNTLCTRTRSQSLRMLKLQGYFRHQVEHVSNS